ncbi:MAG: zinc ribbon domain-containing protein, partial [Pyrinomonadaceae bacterium]|nr:zinc ribbon domain-containing protein [Pyrinomonadaceae bacterium]
MFCPRCAAHNIDDARYCRVCGADISLLPQMLSGQFTADLASTDEAAVEETGKQRKGKKKHKEKKTPTLEDAFSNIGVGLAFLIISVMVALYMPGGKV